MYRHLTAIWFLLFLIIVNSPDLEGQPSISAIKFSRAPVIDGHVDEECWQETPAITEFYQREPNPGEPSTISTEIFVGYDKNHLYIAMRCFSDPDDIIANELARDANLSNDDRVQIILDTYNDKRNGYWFQIGPRGSIGDAIMSENGAAFNKAWDGLWSGKAQILDNAWEAEIAIPFKTLNFNPDNDAWGFKLIRYQKSIEETVYWPSANINSARFQVSDAGLITGLKDISQGVGLDLVPYGLTGLNVGENADGPVFNAGFEGYYNISSNLKVAVSVNTDFAQTEVDQQQINLTRFNLFYPEKRDFFLDGANYFNFGINGDDKNSWNKKMIPFFSRRIGLDENGNPIPVEYGSKITGQAGKWNIGAIYMKDRREISQNGHFAVSRISRNIGEESQIGMMTTYGNALSDARNFLVGLDLRLATSKFKGDKNIMFTAFGMKSDTWDPEGSDRPAGRDLTYGIEFNYPNDKIALRLGHMEIQENFIAGLGFIPRPGVKESYGELTLGYRPGKWGLLQILTSGEFDFISDFDQRLLTRKWSIKPLRIRFTTGDEFKYSYSSDFELLDESFDLYGNYNIAAGDYTFGTQSISFQTAQKRKLWTSIDFSHGGFYNGSRNEMKLKAGYNLAVPLFLGTEMVRNNVDLGGEGFIANIYRLNLNILFSPDITLYSFVQYDSESAKMGWQSRFQWIIKPGKEIFLVWNSISPDPFDRYYISEGNLRFKVKYTIRF